MTKILMLLALVCLICGIYIASDLRLGESSMKIKENVQAAHATTMYFILFIVCIILIALSAPKASRIRVNI